MGFLARLFAMMRRTKREQIAHRSDAVIRKVLFDIGPDRLLNGNMVLDRRYRMRFYSTVPNVPTAPFLSVIALTDLPETHTLHQLVDAHGLDAPEVLRQRHCLVDAIMRAMAPRAPRLRVAGPHAGEPALATQR